MDWTSFFSPRVIGMLPRAADDRVQSRGARSRTYLSTR